MHAIHLTEVKDCEDCLYEIKLNTEGKGKCFINVTFHQRERELCDNFTITEETRDKRAKADRAAIERFSLITVRCRPSYRNDSYRAKEILVPFGAQREQF